MKMHIAVVAGLGALVAIGLAPGASAQPKGKPCQPDIDKLCKGVEFGGGRVRECLKTHAAELSPGCKEMLETKRGVFAEGARTGRRQAMLKACEADLEKHCKGVQPGGGRLKLCLDQHRSELSEACTKAFPQSAKQDKSAQKPK